jgi:predicted nucleic acid-binding protein
MILSAIPRGSSVFVDANIFIYAFAPDPQLGPHCELLLERIETRRTSTDVT